MSRPKGKIDVVCQNPKCLYYLRERGKDIINIERITGHHRDIIGMLLGDMAEHAEQMNEYLINNLGLIPSECDELWRFVKEHKRKLSVAAQLGLMKVRHGSTPL